VFDLFAGPESAVAVGAGGAIAKLSCFFSNNKWTLVKSYTEDAPDLSTVVGW
jgi:hypothetical protein